MQKSTTTNIYKSWICTIDCEFLTVFPSPNKDVSLTRLYRLWWTYCRCCMLLLLSLSCFLFFNMLCCDVSMLFLWYATFCPVSFLFCGVETVSRFYPNDSKGFVFLMFAFRAFLESVAKVSVAAPPSEAAALPPKNGDLNLVKDFFCDVFHQGLWITSSKWCLAHDFLLGDDFSTTWVFSWRAEALFAHGSW